MYFCKIDGSFQTDYIVSDISYEREGQVILLIRYCWSKCVSLQKDIRWLKYIKIFWRIVPKKRQKMRYFCKKIVEKFE